MLPILCLIIGYDAVSFLTKEGLIIMILLLGKFHHTTGERTIVEYGLR